jgi:hypothetical protein
MKYKFEMVVSTACDAFGGNGNDDNLLVLVQNEQHLQL